MRKTTMLMFAMLATSGASMAAGQMKPGLWEMSMKSDAMTNAMKNMPKMSAEQIEQMKKMGVTLPSQDGVMKSKVCISKQMAERDEAPRMDQKDTGCQSKNYQRSGNGYSVDIICDGPNMKGTGKATGTFSGNESFNSTYAFKGTSHGQPVDHKQDASGKWLGADCGSIKPMDEMGKK
jgi:hypothetical protein